MKNKVVKNYLYNISYHILTFITPIITSPYLARTLGSKSMGINTYTYSIIYWFILFGMMGIEIYGSKEIAKVSNDRKKLSIKFSEIFGLQLLNLILLSLAFYLTVLNLDVPYKNAFLLQGVMIISASFNVSWLYTGVEDFKKISLRNFFIKILTIILILLTIKNPKQYMLFIGISVGMNILSHFIMWVNIRKYIDFYIPSIKGIYSHLKECFVLFIPQIATTIYSVFDQTMIGFLYKNVSEVTFYAQAHKFINMLLFITTTIGVVMLPRIVKKRVNEGDEEVKKLTNKNLKIALFLAFPIAFGVMAIAPYFIPWFLTESFQRVGYIMFLLAPVIIFISVTNVLGTQYMITTDKYKAFTSSVIFGCIINLILNGITIPYLGGYGAAIGTIVTEFSIMIYQIYVLRCEFDFDGIKVIISKYLLLSLLMFLITFMIGYFLGVGIYTTILQVLVGIAFYLIILFISKDRIFYFFIDKIKSLLIKKEDI